MDTDNKVTSPATPRAIARETKTHEKTPEVHIPMHAATDREGGTYYIARPMQGTLMEVNLAEMVVMFFTGKVSNETGKRMPPELVLRMRDDLDEGF